MKSNADILKMKTASAEELKAQILSMKKDMMKMRFELTTGQLKDVSSISKTRKNIARLKTFLNANNNKTK